MWYIIALGAHQLGRAMACLACNARYFSCDCGQWSMPCSEYEVAKDTLLEAGYTSHSWLKRLSGEEHYNQVVERSGPQLEAYLHGSQWT